MAFVFRCYDLSTMLYLLCFISCTLSAMLYLICFIWYALPSMLHLLFFICYSLSAMLYLLCFIFYALSAMHFGVLTVLNQSQTQQISDTNHTTNLTSPTNFFATSIGPRKLIFSMQLAFHLTRRNFDVDAWCYLTRTNLNRKYYNYINVVLRGWFSACDLVLTILKYKKLVQAFRNEGLPPKIN